MKTHVDGRGRVQAGDALTPRAEAARSRKLEEAELGREDSPAHRSTSDFWPPDLGENTFLLLEAPRVWSFVTEAPGNGTPAFQPFKINWARTEGNTYEF